MPRSPGSKGQFFFMSLMLIITFLSGVQALFAGFSDIDSSQAFSDQENFWFWNIKSQINRTFEERDCPQLAVDFQELDLVTAGYMARKGIELDLRNTTPLCPPQIVRIEMNMTSTRINIFDNFTLVSH